MYKPMMGGRSDVSSLAAGLITPSNPTGVPFQHNSPSSHGSIPLPPPANFAMKNSPPSAPHAASQTAVISPFRKTVSTSSASELATAAMTSPAPGQHWQQAMPHARAASHVPVSLRSGSNLKCFDDVS